MPFQKVEYEFPETDVEEGSTDIEIEASDEIEIELLGKEKAQEVVEAPEPDIEVLNDVPEPDIEVVNDVPEKDRNRLPSTPPEEVTDEELEDYSDKVQKRIRHFSKGYHDERRAKETAERQSKELETLAQKLLNENNNLKDNLSKNKDVLMRQAKKAVENDFEKAKTAYRSAYEEGDSERLLNAQNALTKAEIATQRLDTLQNNNQALQTSENKVQTSIREPQNNATVPVDSRALQWQENNKWFGTVANEPETAFALGLHKQITEAEGVSADSDEYYDRLNSRMLSKFPELFGETNEQEVRVPKSRPDNVVAPATRSTAPRKIRLTQTQVALSKRLGLTPAQYAKQVALDMGKQ
tara:strand:- start:146 stop:1207 length:1062 start_codon:yes stop_codon:yes gene_type:complete